jgi:hypothetical protein
MKSPIIDRARKYLAAMPVSISGSGGRITAFNAASTLVRGFALTDDESLTLLMEWNQKCTPPWSALESIAKIKSAHRDSRKEYGCLLANDDRRQTTGSTSKLASILPTAPAERMGYDAADLARKATMQAKWPIPRHLTGPEKGAFATLRNLPAAAVDIACQNGRLMADDSRPGCVLLTDGRTDGRGHRQYRHLDGSPFHHGEKSDNAKGSAGKGFFTLSHSRKLDPDGLIFITEGTISLFEAVACQWLCEGKARRWHYLASHFCGSTFAAEPELLKSIAGHHVRILPDQGKAGMDAARAWRHELRAVGCPVDFAFMPKGSQDLRLILAAGSDGVAAARSILTYPTPSKSGGAK